MLVPYIRNHRKYQSALVDRPHHSTPYREARTMPVSPVRLAKSLYRTMQNPSLPTETGQILVPLTRNHEKTESTR